MQNNIWALDRYSPFEIGSERAMIAYFDNFYGDLDIGDSTSSNLFEYIVGYLNDFTVKEYGWDADTYLNDELLT